MPAIGYDHPNQSHFTSRHFWEVGRDRRAARDRLARPLPRPRRHARTTRCRGSRSTGASSRRSRPRRCRSPSLDGPDRYDFWTRGVWGEVERDARRRSAGSARSRPTATPALRRRRATRRAVGAAARAAAAVPAKDDKPALHEPGHLSDARTTLPTAARRARGDARRGAAAPLRRARRPGGYDTHDNQAGDLADGLKLTADSLLAFQRDLEARGLADRVLVHVWSEFGRRAKENGSGGTDHGAAGTGFLIGTRATGTMVGEFPGLAEARRRRQPAATSDFRGVYGALLEQWLGTDADAIIPGARHVRPAEARPMRRSSLRSRRRRGVGAAASAAARAAGGAQVSADEFRLTLSRSTIRRGPAIVELVNYGEDDHDLALRRARRDAHLPDRRRPARRAGRARDPPCPDVRPLVHARRPSSRGMRATLLVR